MIPLFKVHMPLAVDKPLLEVLHSGYIGQGKKVDEFEAALGERLSNRNVLTVNSGTSAITLALRLAGVEGGEVISSPMTCMATNTPILDNRAVPVWADVDPRTGLIDPTDVERKITPRTKAIIAVDWGGLPCDYSALRHLEEKYGIPVIEDAAHGLGAIYGPGMGPVGGTWMPSFTCFSFQAIKHITTVDGGLLVCKDSDDYRRGKLLRWYGIDRETERKDLRCEEDVVEWGYKFHMNDVAATIGLVQLIYLDSVVNAQRDNAHFYIDALTRSWVVGFRDLRSSILTSAWWLFTMHCLDAADRESFRLFLAEKGIMASQVHVRNDQHTVFKPYVRNLPGVDEFANRHICIPVHWGLTENEKEQIATACLEYAEMAWASSSVG